MMNRRNFIKSSIAFPAAVAVGYFPLFSLEEKDRNRNIFTDTPAIEPITGELLLFHPKPSIYLSAGLWQLTFDLIRWHGIQDDGLSLNIKDGSLQVMRDGNAISGFYLINRRMSLPVWCIRKSQVHRSQECYFEAKIKTQGENESVYEWQINTFHNDCGENALEQPDSRRIFEGKYDGKTVLISSENVFLYERQLTGPLIVPWVIPELLLRKTLSRSIPFQFTLLDEGVRLRRNQKLIYEGEVEIETAGGTLRGDAWLQTGTGILPIHWITDAQGCLQIMTHSALNWILREAVNR